MKTTRTQNLLAATLVGVLAFITTQAGAQTEPLGGQPAPGAKPSVKNLEDQVAYQRAFEAVIWSQPAIGIYGLRRGMIEGLGMKDNEVMAMSGPLKMHHEVLTANNTVPYISANADLRSGPVVLEIPAATAKGVLYGQVVDAWQDAVADVGPSGQDKGNGGKYLFLPPGYGGDVPSGYFVVPSTSYRIAFAFRSIKLAGATDADANAYAKTLKMYPLSEAANPKPTRFVDAIDQRLSTLPFYDWRYFEDLSAIVSVEPVRARDKVMMGMLASIGIEPGRPFNPSPKMKEIMTRAAVDAYFYMQDRFEKAQMKNLYWLERHWSYFFLPDPKGGFAWETETALLYDNRSDTYHPATYFPQKLPAKPATVYLCGMADSQGRPLEAGKTYKLNVPKDVPVKQFWSLVVYDFATWAFIYSPLDRPGLSSYDKSNMKVNADGSVDLYIGPKAPEGLESNWIPTQGKRPFPVVRLYGPDEAFWDKSFKMPDVELVK
jgi:hypothetical protein